MNRAFFAEPEKRKALAALAARYVWWKTPEEAIERPERVIAQVMEMGDYEDARRLVRLFGAETLRMVLRCAESGQFSAPSWHYWHYRLGLARPGRVPPMPERRLG